MRESLDLSISQYYRMLLFRTCSPTAEASGLSPVQCEFESHQVYFPVRLLIFNLISHQVYLCVEMAKMVDAAGSNPVGFNPSEFESRFPHLRRITRKAQRRYLGYRDDKFVGSNPTSGTMQQWLNRYSNGLLLRHPLMRSAGSIPVYYALNVHSLKVKHQSPKL